MFGFFKKKQKPTEAENEFPKIEPWPWPSMPEDQLRQQLAVQIRFCHNRRELNPEYPELPDNIARLITQPEHRVAMRQLWKEDALKHQKANPLPPLRR